MSFKCKISLHSWDGCKCSECEKTRDKQHDWSIDCDKCSKCGKTRENAHDWTKDCDKCSKCGKTRENAHDWTMDCKCSKCAKTRDEKHDWKGCKCIKCGIIRDEQHVLSISSWNCCSECNKIINFEYLDSRDIGIINEAFCGKINLNDLVDILIKIFRKSYFEAYATEDGICGNSCSHPTPKLIKKGKVMKCPYCKRVFRPDHYNENKCNVVVALIGNVLFEKGGQAMMRIAYNQFEQYTGEGYKLDSAWEGIGGWVYFRFGGF
jgi:hypothetical protein